MENDLVPQRCEKSELWGYVENINRFIIAPKFNYAETFRGELAIIGSFDSKLIGYKDNEYDIRYGFINKSGNEVTGYKYYRIEYNERSKSYKCFIYYFDSGYPQKNGKEIEFLNYIGEIIVDDELTSGIIVTNEAVYYDGYSYFTNQNYEDIKFFRNDTFLCLKKGRLTFEFINKFGEIIPFINLNEVIHDQIKLFLSYVSRESGQFVINDKFGYINIEGNITIPFVYDWLSAPFNSTIIANLNGKFSLLRENGEILSHFIYSKITFVSAINAYLGEILNQSYLLCEESLFLPNKIGYLEDFVTIPNISVDYTFEEGVKVISFKNQFNKVILKCLLDKFILFSNSYCALKFNSKYGLINFKGEFLISNIYDYCFKLSDTEFLFAKTNSNTVIFYDLNNSFLNEIVGVPIKLPGAIPLKDVYFSLDNKTKLILVSVEKRNYMRKLIGYMNKSGDCFWESMGRFTPDYDYYNDLE